MSLLLFPQPSGSTTSITTHAGIFYKYPTTSIVINDGVTYTFTSTDITSNFGVVYRYQDSFDVGVFYEFNASPITHNEGIFYDVTVPTPISFNYGITYTKYTSTIIETNDGVFYTFSAVPITKNVGVTYNNGYTLTACVLNPALIAYISGLTLFSFTQDYIYKKTPINLAINKIINDAQDITTQVGSYTIPSTYYNTTEQTDTLILNSVQLADFLSGTEDVTITLAPPIQFTTGLCNTKLSETQSLEVSPNAETDTAETLEIRDADDQLATYIFNTVEPAVTYTTYTCLLWYDRYTKSDVTANVLVKATANTFDEWAATIVINGVAYALANAMTQTIQLDPNTSASFYVEYSVSNNVSLSDTLSLQFFVGNAPLFNKAKFGIITFNQIESYPLMEDALLSIGVIKHSTNTIMSLLSGGMAGLEDKHV